MILYIATRSRRLKGGHMLVRKIAVGSGLPTGTGGEKMGIPGYQRLMSTLLQYAKDGREKTVGAAAEDLAAAYNLTPEEQ
ncbi:MAG TPA: hypothetical protein DD734_07890, partial [Firmicutes bacterium]|nr:hypothetical protein [Bacillota bacterium]